MNTEPKIYSFDSSLLPDANPKDGFCVDLVRAGDYASLKAERDALADRVERLGGMLTESRVATKSAEERADALAVENQALRSKAAELVHEASEVYSAYNATIREPDGDFMDMQTLYEMQCIETPATSAALAAIRNEATERTLKHLSDCQLISATVAELKAYELREAK